jgi:hypothetical protein
MREALLRPRVVRDFLTRYNGSRVPTEQIARNVLEEMNGPAAKTGDVLALIVDGARELGLLREVKGQIYVDLESTDLAVPSPPITDKRARGEGSDDDTDQNDEGQPTPLHTAPVKPLVAQPAVVTSPTAKRISRVFITHGRNRDIVAQLKELLTFGGFTPVVAIEQEALSKPVPDKVLDDMRSCDAAIIHVGTISGSWIPKAKSTRC